VSSHILAELEDYSTHMLALDAGRAGNLTPLGSAGQELGTWLRLRTAEPVADLAERLGALAQVGELSTHEDYLLFRFRGDAEGRAGLLRELIEQGVAVSEFAEAPPALRTLYLDSVKEAE
jgi:ABC-2 type transport system ATP-binding protein